MSTSAPGIYEELFALSFTSFLLDADPALFPAEIVQAGPRARPEHPEERVQRICNADPAEHLEAIARAHNMNLAALVTHLCECWRKAGFVGEPAWLDESAHSRPLYNVGPHDFVVLSRGTGTHDDPRVAVFPSCDELVRPVIQRQGNIFLRWTIPYATRDAIKIADTAKLGYLAGPCPVAHDNSSKHTSTTRAGTSFVSGSFAIDENGHSAPRALDSASSALRQLLHEFRCSLLPPTWISSDSLVWRFLGTHAAPGQSTEAALRTSAGSLDARGTLLYTASPAPHVVWRLEVPRRDSRGTLVLDGDGRRTTEVWDVVFSTKYAWAVEEAHQFMRSHHPELAPPTRALSLAKARFVAQARGAARIQAFA
ncbi:hypothetical protein JCM9279_002311 [Rhodotorula babjevae]